MILRRCDGSQSPQSMISRWVCGRQTAPESSQFDPAPLDTVASVRLIPLKSSRNDCNANHARSPEIVRRTRSSPFIGFSRCFAVAVLVLSGCVTTVDQIRERPGGLTSTGAMTSNQEVTDTVDPALQVRHQSAANDGTDGCPSSPPEQELPPLPDLQQAANTPETAPSATPSTLTLPTVPSRVPLLASAPGANAIPDGRTLQGLSSIARNRLSNRLIVAPPSESRDATSDATGRPINSVFENMNPILRNRLGSTIGADNEPQFNFPDIHDDPAKRYHDLYGVDDEHDPFVLPWVMNLIFEDRWLLDEKDPGLALKNQLQRRTKIDIRDPDPDTANFPNGAYTLPKGRLYIENSPLGLYSASKNGNQPRIYQWEYLIRYGLTDNLEFRVFSNGLSDQEGQGKQPTIVG